jgi:hypothetical protein
MYTPLTLLATTSAAANLLVATASSLTTTFEKRIIQDKQRFDSVYMKSIPLTLTLQSGFKTTSNGGSGPTSTEVKIDPIVQNCNGLAFVGRLLETPRPIPTPKTNLNASRAG